LVPPPDAIVWLAVVGGAGLFLFGLDVLYDLEHGIYADARGGSIELGIDLLTGISSAGVILFAWQHREPLLIARRPGRVRD
jgi:phosphate/sulfate permease